MTDWLYPEIINELVDACNDFLDEKITVQEVQSKIYSAEGQIVAVDEKWLRSMLFDAENEIELLTYTVEDNQLRSSVIPIVQSILNKIN